jgi:hypothetical protein
LRHQTKLDHGVPIVCPVFDTGTDVILVALRKRNGATVVGGGAPARWQLKEAANRGGLQFNGLRSRPMYSGGRNVECAPVG